MSQTHINIVFADNWCSLTPFDLSPRGKVLKTLHTRIRLWFINQQLWSAKICILHKLWSDLISMSTLGPSGTGVSCIKKWESLGEESRCSCISYHTNIKFNPLIRWCTPDFFLSLNFQFDPEFQKMGSPQSEKQATDAADPITNILSPEELGDVEKLPGG